MCEQDYMIKMNKDAAKMFAKIIFNKDIRFERYQESDEQAEDACSCKLFERIETDNIPAIETDLFRAIDERRKRSLERAVLFYTYLNEKDDDFLQEHNYTRENIKEGFERIAKKVGIYDIIQTIYL